MNRNIPLIVLLLMTFGLVCSSGTTAKKNQRYVAKKNYSYSIIRGEAVNMRAEPNIKSKVVRVCKKNELSIYLETSKEKEKVNNEEYVWYKVKTLDGKEGWIFGKYIYQLDPKKKADVLYKYILDDSIAGSGIVGSNTAIVFDLSFENPNAEYIVVRYTADFFEEKFNRCINHLLKFYEKIGNDDIRVVYWTNDFDTKYSFIEDYIVIWDRKFIGAYDPKIVTGRSSMNRRFKQLDYINLNHFREKNHLQSTYDSFLKFDLSLRIITVHLRTQKNSPMQVIKYKIEKGKFIKME